MVMNPPRKGVSLPVQSQGPKPDAGKRHSRSGGKISLVCLFAKAAREAQCGSRGVIFPDASGQELQPETVGLGGVGGSAGERSVADGQAPSYSWPAPEIIMTLTRQGCRPTSSFAPQRYSRTWGLRC
jgi:hypothetical protein